MITKIKRYHMWLKICAALFMVGLFFYGNTDLFSIICVGIYIVAVLRSVSIPSKKRMKFIMIVTYSLLLPVQMLMNESADTVTLGLNLAFVINRALCLIGIAMPFAIERFFIVNQHATFYMPSLSDLSTFSMNEIMHGKEALAAALSDVQKAGKALSPENIITIATDMPRHNSFRYINNGTLTEEYFREAYASLNDLRIYIVISNTGSAASEIISVFTKKLYNHASLSFDADLKTIISYNGGERVYPPGLNREMIDFFNHKEDASIIVYSLDATFEQKKAIIDKIREINEEGSAYNVLGLVLKQSHKANIMFCSQFVYKMLKSAGLNYFDKPDGKVSPTDLVELDYYRKLHYVSEIKFAKSE